MVHVLTPDWGQINIQYSDTDWTVQHNVGAGDRFRSFGARGRGARYKLGQFWGRLILFTLLEKHIRFVKYCVFQPDFNFFNNTLI